MPTIGLVDDRKDLRTSTRKAIEYALRRLDKNWTVVDVHPFTEVEDYFPWIRNNEVCILLVDERLHESKSDLNSAVTYNGHTLVSSLRERYRELPIVAITSYADDAELQSHLSYFDNIVDRKLFGDHSKEYVARFIRFGQKFIDEYAAELKLISEISARIATGNGSDDDINKLSLLQTKLGLMHPALDLPARAEWLSMFEGAVENLEAFKNEILKKINEKQ